MTRFLGRLCALPLMVCCLPLPAQETLMREPQVPDLKVEKYTLPNGLEVVLHQDDTIPVAAVNIWYKVGSKNEVAGRTGFAHLFEHLMFQGSQHHDAEYFEPLELLGAQINGSTSTDRTNYFESLPSNGLERALWLESDRMGFLVPALSQEKLDNQREVVKNERRQRVDNVPYGLSEERMLEAVYPEGHPYRHSVIGSMADLSAASLEDVQNFFRTYYTPNNASLVLAGNFDTEAAKALIEKYFGPIPRGPDVPKLEPQVPVLAGPKHERMTDRVTQALIELSWPTVQAGHPDEPALDILAAVLGGLEGENRLYRKLQFEKQVATSISASHPTSVLSGTFEVRAMVTPGANLDEVVGLIDAEIDRLQKEGPLDAEVYKAKVDRESSLVYGLESALGKADFLNSNNVFYGDPLAYKEETRKLFQVTPADVKRVAEKYLTANRVRLDVLPGPQAQRPPEVEVDRKGQLPISVKPVEIQETFDRSKMPEVGPSPEFSPPPVNRFQLSNGLSVLISERHELPILTLNLIVKSGQNMEAPGQEGLAGIVAGLLSEGTKTRDNFALAGDLAEIGASLRAGFQRESGSLGLTTLTAHTDRGIELFQDVLMNSTFPESAFARLQAEKVASLERRPDNPQAIAGVVFPKVLYGVDHPYGRIETVESVKSLKREDAVAFFQEAFVASNATLVACGDTTAEAIRPKLEAALGGWKVGQAPVPPATEVSGPKPVGIYLVDKPGSAQSVLFAGHVGVPRLTPDYFAIEIMNAILGGQFSSRLNMNLREEKGYTYGARTFFAYRLGPGPFVAGTSVQTAVTAPALAEMVREIAEIREKRPVTAEEVEFARGNLVRGFPAEFETTFGAAGQLGEIAVYSLPGDYFTTYQANLEKVTAEEVNGVAKRYLDPENLTIVVVGDRSKIEESIRALPFAKKITLVDPEGNPAP